MGAEKKEDVTLEYIAKVEKLDSDVTNLKSSFDGFAKRFENVISELFTELKTHQKDTAPKPLSMTMILSGVVAILTILAILFGSVVWTISSMNRPISTQVDQINRTQSAQSTLIMQNASLIQLTNKEISGIKGKAEANTDTLQWILFAENLPKQITNARKDIERLQMQMDRVIDSVHNKEK